MIIKGAIKKNKWAEALHVKLCKHFAVSVTSGPSD